jgi:hypothetical protein
MTTNACLTNIAATESASQSQAPVDMQQTTNGSHTNAVHHQIAQAARQALYARVTNA